MGLVRILSDSLRFFGGNLGQIVTLCLPLILGAILLGHVLNVLWQPAAMGTIRMIHGYTPWAADLIFYPLYTGALIVLMAKRTAGQSPGNREILKEALSVWWPFFLLNLIVTVLIAIGLLLFVIPGIWLTVRLAFAKFLLVLDRVSPVEAMRRSIVLSKSRFWLILKCLYVVLVSMFLLNLVVGFAVAQLGSSLIVSIVVAAVFGILTLYLTIVMFRIFLLATDSVASGEGTS